MTLPARDRREDRLRHGGAARRHEHLNPLVRGGAASAHMGSMRTLDRKYLAAHPAGDEAAVFTVSIELPESAGVPNNPDGTRPEITLRATSDTYANLLGVLSYVHDEEVSDNVFALVLANVAEEDLEAYESMEAAAPFLREAAAQVVLPFRTFKLPFALEADGEPTAMSAELELTAPDMINAARALKTMTRPQVLTEVAISFSPVLDDEDDYDSNEVLVVS